MKHKKLLTIFCIVALLWSTAAPALANSATDPIGAATTIFQLYLTEGAQGELRLNTNVAGKSPDAENYMDTALNLSTRLMPFSLDASMQYYANTNPTTFFVKFRGREYNDLNSQVQNKAKEIVADAQMYTTDYEKLRYINNYIIDNCEYVSAAVKNPEQYHTAFTIYGCLGEGKAVCEGYANTVQLLCEMMQIPCIKVTGTAYGGNHIWNAVYLNDKWWMLDVTFNDPVGLQDSSDRWSYFLLDLDTFQQKGTHTYDKTHYEHSKEIYTGRTTGQKSVSLPFANLSMQNSVSGDIPDPRYLTDIGAVTATPEQPDKQQPSDHQSSGCIGHRRNARHFDRSTGLQWHCCDPRRYCGHDLCNTAAHERTATANSNEGRKRCVNALYKNRAEESNFYLAFSALFLYHILIFRFTKNSATVFLIFTAL